MTEIVCRFYLVIVDDTCLLVDLVVLELIDFDVILGIDFLSTHGVTLEYKDKIVWFRGQDKLEVVFREDKSSMPKGLIFGLQSHRLLRRGY